MDAWCMVQCHDGIRSAEFQLSAALISGRHDLPTASQPFKLIQVYSRELELQSHGPSLPPWSHREENVIVQSDSNCLAPPAGHWKSAIRQQGEVSQFRIQEQRKTTKKKGKTSPQATVVCCTVQNREKKKKKR